MDSKLVQFTHKHDANYDTASLELDNLSTLRESLLQNEVASSSPVDPVLSSDTLKLDNMHREYHRRLHTALMDSSFFSNETVMTNRFFSLRIMCSVFFGLVASLIVMLLLKGASAFHLSLFFTSNDSFV
jgi:hypothetical protein